MTSSADAGVPGRVRLPLLLLLVCSSWLLPRCDARRTLAAAGAPATPIRAVNLGGWLLTEGWILPSLFDDIPNNDLLVTKPILLVLCIHERRSSTELALPSVNVNR